MIASYFGWAQNIQELFPWGLETVLARLQQRLEAADAAVRRPAARVNTDLRTAAYEIGIGRVARAVDRHGSTGAGSRKRALAIGGREATAVAVNDAVPGPLLRVLNAYLR